MRTNVPIGDELFAVAPPPDAKVRVSAPGFDSDDMRLGVGAASPDLVLPAVGGGVDGTGTIVARTHAHNAASFREGAAAGVVAE